MRKYYYLAYDVACICGALLIALYLRHGFPLIVEGEPHDIYVLLLVTMTTALVTLPLMRTHTGVWRFTSSSDLAKVMVAVALVILVCNSTLFLISRLEMMPRSVPPMQWALAVVAMGGSRVLARKLFGPTRSLGKPSALVNQHVLVVGACHTAELYLQFIKRIVQHPITVQGIIDSDKNLANRLFQSHKIIGATEDLPRIMEQFLVHGIQIHQVVLAQSLDDLTASERAVLLEMERSGVVELVHFAKHMGPQMQPRAQADGVDFYQQVRTASAGDYTTPVGRYAYVKRAFDVVMAGFLLIVLSPLMALTYVAVALDVGFPVIFWQQRPGLHGKPFQLYKFRTMRAAGRKRDQDRLSHKSGDANRTSAVGKILRRLRWDELPQLIHIIAGTMSFVGPRPLLPEDQPVGGQQRLSVRPGITGWAQIHGGDALTPQQKLELDRWYIHHMSFWLDVRILLRTLIVVLKEDKACLPAIPEAQPST